MDVFGELFEIAGEGEGGRRMNAVVNGTSPRHSTRWARSIGPGVPASEENKVVAVDGLFAISVAEDGGDPIAAESTDLGESGAIGLCPRAWHRCENGSRITNGSGIFILVGCRSC